MNNKTDITSRYVQLFRENKDRITGNSTPYINSFREQAMNSFEELGIPTRKNETYKYTNLDLFFSHDYGELYLPQHDDYLKAEEFRCDIADLDTHGQVLVNGFYPVINEKIAKLPGGIWIGSLNEAAKVFPDIVGLHYNKYAKAEGDGLVHLNTAMAYDGIFIYVPDGVVLSKPVQIVNLVYATRDVFNQHRNLIIAGKNSEATIIICDHTLSPGMFLTNAVTEIFAGENSRFDLIRVQNEHNSAGKITHTFIHQEKDSNASSNNITLHGGLIRNSTHHFLCGKGAESHSFGLYLADKFQHVDNYVNIVHQSPDCTSNQLFKGVLDDMATGAFNGRIFVGKEAQKTMAYQKNNSILLTDDAKMDSKPQLEIYADDVKCSHGATVGQLDENALFYLRSRGISLKEARLMLMYGFAHDVIQNIRVEPLKERIDNLVMQRLRGELSRCASCMVKCG